MNDAILLRNTTGGIMKTAGIILQVMAWVVALGAIAGGIAILAAPERNYWLAAGGVVAGITGGALLFGIGGVFLFVEDVAIDARRTADSLGQLLQRRKTPTPP